MKILNLIIAILFSCCLNAQEFNISFDTLDINVPGSPRPWINYQNFILAYFNTSNPYGGGDKQFYIFDIENSDSREVLVPEELQMSYFDLFIRNDSVFIIEYIDQDTYFLDFESFELVKTKKCDDLIYEDEDYYVTSLDFGEWGGCTWFINKKTGEQYELGVTTPFIHKVDSGYIVTTDRSIYLIKHITDLDRSDSPYEYEKVVGNRRGLNRFFEPSSSMNGIEVLFSDTSSFWDSDFYIATSFIQDNQLYYMCVDSNALYISHLEKGKLESIYKFNDPVRPLRQNRILNNHYQSLEFWTKDDHVYGLFEFNEHEIKATYVKNNYRIPVLGSSQSNSWFRDNFKYYFKNLDSLYLSTSDSIEEDVRAIDVTPRHKMTTSLKPELELASPKCFQKVEDSLIVLETMYYYTIVNQKVEIIKFEWSENTLFTNDFHFILEEENEKYKAISNKYDSIKEYLIEMLGEPTSDSHCRDCTWTYWETEEYVVSLDSFTVLEKQHLKTSFYLRMYKN